VIPNDITFMEEQAPKQNLNNSAISELTSLVTPTKGKSEIITLILLTITSCTVFMISYVTLYSTTAMPGNKMTAGMVFRLAESSSSLLSGVVCSKF